MRWWNRFWLAVGVALISIGCSSSSSHLPKPRPPADDDDPPPQAVAAKPAAKTPTDSAEAAPDTANGFKALTPTAADQKLSELDRRKRVINQLRQISKALETYREKNGIYPHRTVGSGISWRVLLLPFLGQSDLYLKFHLNEPWDSAHNRELLSKIPDVYQSLEHPDEKTNFQFVTGLNTAYADPAGVGENCPDGFEHTMFLVEVADELAQPWTQPADYEFIRHEVQRELFGSRKDCCFAILGGASGARRIAADISDQNLLALMTPAGGERVLAADVTSYPYPELDNELIAALTKTPPQRFVIAKAKSPDDEQVGAGGAATSTAAAQTPDGKATAPVASNDPRLAMPDEDAIKKAAALVKEIFGSEYEAAKKPDQKRTFAKKMLVEAGKLVADKTGAFVLYRAARDVAAAAGDLETSLAAIDKLAATYRVDAIAMKIKALDQAAPAVQGDAELQKLYDVALQLTDGALAKDDFANAKQSIGLALNAARRSTKKERIVKATEKQSELLETRLAYNRVSDHVHALVRDPGNPAANAAVGKYYCFIKRDWDRGLEMLARGDDEKLADLAHRERSLPTTAEGLVELGDQWWEYGETHRTDLQRLSVRKRAVHWYEQALPSLAASLSKSRVEKRIAEDKHEASGTSAAPARDTARARRSP